MKRSESRAEADSLRRSERGARGGAKGPHEKTPLRTHLIAVTLCLASVAVTGCEAPGVGDPCQPEEIPDDGFQQSEVYLETRSLQCRTRVCLVNHLKGNPTVTDANDPLYVSPATVEERVYCTCKCDGQDEDTIRCEECPDGFECCPAFTIGPPGLRGSYCVRKDTCSADEEGG